MGAKDYDGDVDRLLNSAGFPQFRGVEQNELRGITVHLVKESDELDAAEVANFFLEERGNEGNLFTATFPEVPGRPEIRTLVIRTTAKSGKKQIFFFEEPGKINYISFVVLETEDPDDPFAAEEVSIDERHSQITLKREDIIGVRFQITEVRRDAGILLTRSISIENAQGYSLRLDDDGYVHLEPFEDDDERTGKEGGDS